MLGHGNAYTAVSQKIRDLTSDNPAQHSRLDELNELARKWCSGFAVEFLDKLRSRPAGQDIPVVIITAKDLTQEDRDRLNGGVERIIQKSDRDEMLRQLSREVSKCVKRQTPRIT